MTIAVAVAIATAATAAALDSASCAKRVFQRAYERSRHKYAPTVFTASSSTKNM